VIYGKACEKSTATLRLEVPIQHRLNIKASVHVEGDSLSVDSIRGAGDWADVVLMIDSRRSFDRPFTMNLTAASGYAIKGEGRLIVARPTPYILGMQTICGGSISMSCPIREDLGQSKMYVAFFEPKIKEFWLSQNKGKIEAGAREFPFKVFFAPRDPRPVETLLAVELEEMEVTVKVCGSTGGFQGRRWGERRH
jgi:hypothetical protein